MSNEQDGADGQDPIKQVKAEFNRKNDSLAQKLEEANKNIAQIMNAVMQQQQTRTESREANDEVDADPIENPKAYAKQVAAAAEKRANALFDQKMAEQNRQRQQESQIQGETQTVLNRLVVDYPELNDRSSELYIKAQEIMSQMPQSEKNSPTALRAAIREAALETDTLPMSKRKKSSKSDVDDFSVARGSGRSSREGSRETGTKIDDKMRAFAELMGRPVDDPEYIKRLEKHAGRTDWNKFKK